MTFSNATTNTVANHAAADAGEGHEYLIFRLDDQEYGIDILKVQEIRGYDAQTLTRIANAPDFIKGVTNLRGTIVPIVDLRLKFGRHEAQYISTTVVVILNFADRVVGAVVDGVSDVMVLQSSQISPAPALDSSIDTRHLTGIGTVGERMIILMDIEKLMSSRDMALIEEAVQ